MGLEKGKNYTNKLTKIVQKLDPDVEVFIIPSFTELNDISKIIKDTPIKLGAQNMYWMSDGPFTGEISPIMLKEVGVEIVELGHSERRRLFGETDINVQRKVKLAVENQLAPLICVGEEAFEKESNAGIETVVHQVKIALGKLTSSEAGKIKIAYEPAWAIGTDGTPASSDYVNQIHTAVRSQLIGAYQDLGKEIPLLYGGSVNLDNFEELLATPNVNGLFIGRAAYNAENFANILNYISLNKRKFK